MDKFYVTEDIAEKLQAKGYPHSHIIHFDNGVPIARIDEVLDWLRDAKRIDTGAVWDNMDGKWVGYINEMDMPDLVGEYVLPNTYDAYEQAVLACIWHVIDNLI